jgi:uncharacterized protein YecT (DUF1311 family)
MVALNRGLAVAAGAAALLAGIWSQGGMQGEAQAIQRAPVMVQQGSYAQFELPEADVEARLSPQYQSCMERAQGTGEMRLCSTAEQRRLTPLMESAFRNAIGRNSNPAVRERLRAEQAAWFQRGRQAHCQRELRESGEEGGSMGLLVLDSCALNELVRRTIWLEQHR